MDDTLGNESRGQMPSYNSLSRISHANNALFSSLYCRIFVMTKGVDTRGLLPPVKIKPPSHVLADLAQCSNTEKY